MERFAMGVYAEILENLSKWRISDSKTIQEDIEYDASYRAFSKRLNILKSNGLLKTYKAPKRNRSLYTITSEGCKLVEGKATGLVSIENCIHDYTTTKIVKTLLRDSNIYHAHLWHEVKAKTYDPDAILYGNYKGQNYNMALEVELNHKNFERVTEKFNKYYQSDFFNYALYIFNRPSVFEAYKRKLVELDELWSENREGLKLSDKIILCLHKMATEEELTPHSTPCFYQNTDKDLKGLLYV